MLSLDVGLRISSGSIFQASAWYCQWTGIRREWTWGGRHHHRAKFTHRPSRDPLGIQNSRVDHLGRDDTGLITTQGKDAKECCLRRMVRTISLLWRLMDCHSSGSRCQGDSFVIPNFFPSSLGLVLLPSRSWSPLYSSHSMPTWVLPQLSHQVLGDLQPRVRRWACWLRDAGRFRRPYLIARSRINGQRIEHARYLACLIQRRPTRSLHCSQLYQLRWIFFSHLKCCRQCLWKYTHGKRFAITVSRWGFGYFFVSPSLHHVQFVLTTVYSNTGAIYYAGSLSVASASIIVGMRKLSARKLLAHV